ncbi:DUF5677 domain-containing protein [Bacillus infantis]|uniref:DUF5677 domain-containing protein n=1 Tax=Bacillus infantis TaxID=324767 RepID=UPI00209F5C18|nr:DUF5677 domain-containing protein [Bacillus infantis]MCP1158183.1 DUF5677 domain-containing protein [Bacillus infantis]
MGRKSNAKKERKKSNYSPISSHQRQGKMLVPPIEQMANLKKVSWSNDTLPEYIWLALIVSLNERKQSLKLLERISEYFGGIKDEKRPIDLTLSNLAKLEESILNRFIEFVCLHLGLKEDLQPLLLFDDLPGRSTWEKHLNIQNPDEEWEKLFITVAKCLDHQSQESTDCRWICLHYMMVRNQLVVPPEMFEAIANYPDKDESELMMIRGLIRSTEIVTRMTAQFHKSEDSIMSSTWPISFWDQGLKDTPCMIMDLGEEVIQGTKVEYANYEKVTNALKSHFFSTVSTTGINAKHDGVFGLSLYCLELLGELINPDNNTSILGRLGLRTIAECYITLAYLTTKDDEDLWRMYRSYGSGQAKLAFLKLEEIQNKPKYIDVSTLEALAGEDQWGEYVGINLGHWESTNLRKMSEVANVKDVYNTFYDWTSGFSHGQWAAVRNSSFVTCDNPMHRLHRIPKPQKSEFNDVSEDAKNLCNKVLDLVNNVYPDFTYRLE